MLLCAPALADDAESVAAASAPASTAPASLASPSAPSRHSVSLAYFGLNFVQPGGSLGYSYRALVTADDLHALVVGAELGSYIWPRNHVGVFLTPRVGWRGRHRSGLQGEVDFHLGLLQAVTPGTYTVTSGVATQGTASVSYLVFGGTLGVGWQFSNVGRPGLALVPFVRAGALAQYPNFDAILIRFVMSAGMEVRL
jgi:hypothetical protein